LRRLKRHALRASHPSVWLKLQAAVQNLAVNSTPTFCVQYRYYTVGDTAPGVDDGDLSQPLVLTLSDGTVHRLPWMATYKDGFADPAVCAAVSAAAPVNGAAALGTPSSSSSQSSLSSSSSSSSQSAAAHATAAHSLAAHSLAGGRGSDGKLGGRRDAAFEEGLATKAVTTPLNKAITASMTSSSTSSTREDRTVVVPLDDPNYLGCFVQTVTKHSNANAGKAEVSRVLVMKVRESKPALACDSARLPASSLLLCPSFYPGFSSCILSAQRSPALPSAPFAPPCF